MNLLLSILIQLAGFYILYNTSARAVFAKRRHNLFLYKHRKASKIAGGVLLAASLLLFILTLGISVGSLFALLSFMTISGCIIILFPLIKT